MRTFLAESVPHRARFAWLGAALAASIAAFVLTRPAQARQPVSFARTMCVEGHRGPHYVRVDVVPSYSKVDGMPIYSPSAQLR